MEAVEQEFSTMLNDAREVRYAGAFGLGQVKESPKPSTTKRYFFVGSDYTPEHGIS